MSDTGQVEDLFSKVRRTQLAASRMFTNQKVIPRSEMYEPNCHSEERSDEESRFSPASQAPRFLALLGITQSVGLCGKLRPYGATLRAIPTFSIQPSNSFSANSHCMRCRSWRSRTFRSSGGKRSNVMLAG